MARPARWHRRVRRGALALGALTFSASCANIFGIEDWQDPPLGSSGQAGGPSASVSSGGGENGSGGGGDGGTGDVHLGTGTSMCDGGGGGAGDPENPTCADCIKNGLETDVDCGGDSCYPCLIGGACENGADCHSGNCVDGVCVSPLPPCVPGEGDAGDPENPTCADCVKNGLETDIDCGGDSCYPCDKGQLCLTAADCESGVCEGSACQ